MTAGNAKQPPKKNNAASPRKSRSIADEQLRLVKSAAQLGIQEYDIRTGTIQWDDQVCELWGVSAEEPIRYETFIDGIHPDDRLSTQQAVDRALDLNSDGTYHAIYRVINRIDGSEHWVEATGRVIFEQQQPVRLIGTVLDITERKRAQLDLEQSHRKMSEILNSIQDDFYVLDRNWVFVHASRLFTSKIGKEPEDLIGHNIWEMFPKHLGTIFEENLRAAMDKGEIRRFEIAGQYPNAWYRMTAFPSAEGITVLGRDISASRQAEQELREKQLMLESFYNSAPLLMGISELDGDTIIAVSGNQAAARFIGANPKELSGKLARDLSQQTESEALWLEKYKQSQRDGVPVQFEYEHIHSTGPRWLQATVTFLGHGPSGRPRFSFVAEEFTARKRREMNLAFLDELNQDIARLSSTEEIMQTLGAKLGTRLKLSSCQLVDIDEANDASHIFYVWNASNIEPVFGYYRISEFLKPEFYDALHIGSVVTVSDTMNDPRTRAEGYARTNVLSFVTVPFHRNGQWKFLISCTASQVRHWRPDEIELIQEFAYRIFPRLERARAEEALRQSETRYRLLHENLRDAFVQVDMDGHIRDCNDLYCQMLGYSREELSSLTYHELTPERWHALEAAIVNDQVITRGFSDVYEKEYRRKNGTIFPVELRTILSRDTSGRPNGMWAIIREISDRKHAEEALRESEHLLRTLNETLEQRVEEKTIEVRRLASDLVIAVQRERQRISHLLHDDLQQRIYALQMQLKYLHDLLKSRNDEAWQDVVQAETELQDILQLTRHISIDLSPPILPGEGLAHAISWLATQMWERYGLAVEIDANGTFELSNEELHVMLFNCVRELLFNIVKHADTHRAFVSLQWVDEILQIEVRDTGRGFQPEEAEPQTVDQTAQSSFGLPTIRHQLNLFGGHMDLNSEEGKGTHVILTVPIPDSV